MRTEEEKRASVAATLRWQKANPEKKKGYDRAYYANHKEKIAARKKAYSQAYYLKNRAKILEQTSQYQKSHRQQSTAKTLRYNARNREKVRAATNQWRKDHKDVTRRWNAANRDKIKAYGAKYHKAHPEVGRNQAKKRRALKAAASINLSGIKEFTEGVKGQPTTTCYYCQKRFPSKDCHFDHIVALSKGGEHSARNLCVSCPDCNLSKGDKSIVAWARVGQQVLSL